MMTEQEAEAAVTDAMAKIGKAVTITEMKAAGSSMDAAVENLEGVRKANFKKSQAALWGYDKSFEEMNK